MSANQKTALKLALLAMVFFALVIVRQIVFNG